jgi:hypothetical protein
MGAEKVKAIELVLDWNLWPRHTAQKLDSTNVSRMKESLRTGFTLPPVLVNKVDNRVVDGFHRTRAILECFGDNAEIDVVFKDYENEEDIFLDAGSTNAHQGLPLSPQDRAHFIIKCRKMKIPPARIADALHMDKERMMKFLSERSAKTQEGENISLPYGASKALSGKILTREQENYVRKSNGTIPEMKISMLINALRSESVIVTEKTLNRLRELRDIIDVFLEKEWSYE